MTISETAIVDRAVDDESSPYGKRRPFAVAAASYGADTRILMASDDLDDIRLQARCAFRFARLALDEAAATQSDPRRI